MNKEIKEFNNWCKENKIPIGQNMKIESVMIADWWLSKLQAQKEEIIKMIEKECREHIACNKLGDTSKGEWVIGFHQGLHWVRNLLKNNSPII